MSIRRPDPELLRQIARRPLRRVVLVWDEHRADGRGGSVYVGRMVELECGHIERARGRKSHRCPQCTPPAA